MANNGVKFTAIKNILPLLGSNQEKMVIIKK